MRKKNPSKRIPVSRRIVAHYIEEIDSAEERRGGATRRSLNPGKEGPREEERRGRFASSRGPGAEQRHRRVSAEKTAPSSKKTTARRMGVAHSSRARAPRGSQSSSYTHRGHLGHIYTHIDDSSTHDDTRIRVTDIISVLL
ncbi:hypothetical protein EYF80_029472 [Liparis tanakae]|uniref:Uncharacterized protein n=1 Tax=Liparis tanakae TaxID=230148 RepID=A0A4Z2H369_9TELE|nr:hypothetical protein EYF80_029472 [Liparis tanakae]